ncbi:MAG: DUF4271 domain-containing protein [Bacteroidaceae bacterium]|nr:DUF4271 domain-containing protein [Bacteroidaceae bacterium]
MDTVDSLSQEQPQAADTLCQAEPQDTVVDELLSFDDCNFFSDDSLLHAEQPYRPYGFGVEATPFRLRQDAWSGLLLLVCLLLAASLVMRLSRKFKELLRGVFFPIPGKKEEPIVDDPLRYSTRVVAVVLLSLTAAVVTFTYTQHEVGFYLFPETPYILLGALFLLWMGYFLLKRMMSGFVNWVFFRSEKIFTMHRVYTFIYVAEALLSLMLALVVAFLPVPHDEVLILSLCLVIFVKTVLLFKTYQIFFPKMYGTLHLIVYFCTLEIMPLLVLWQALAYMETLSVIKL